MAAVGIKGLNCKLHTLC